MHLKHFKYYFESREGADKNEMLSYMHMKDKS